MREEYMYSNSGIRYLPMIQPHPIPYWLEFSHYIYVQIVNGFIPEAMEQKWVIFLEDDVIHICRSWTGKEIFRANIKRDGDEYFIDQILVEREPSRYSLARSIGIEEADNSDKNLFLHCFEICYRGAPVWEP